MHLKTNVKLLNNDKVDLSNNICLIGFVPEKKYYNRKGFTRRKIESHKSLTKFYCNMTRWKYIK